MVLNFIGHLIMLVKILFNMKLFNYIYLVTFLYIHFSLQSFNFAQAVLLLPPIGLLLFELCLNIVDLYYKDILKFDYN